jgi:Flp pilus assembly protein TadG
MSPLFRHLSPSSPRDRRGAVTVLAALLSVALLALVALAVDVGYVLSSKEEMQRCADAAALAAAWEYGKGLSDGYSSDEARLLAVTAAGQYSNANRVGNKGLDLVSNASNAPQGDVVFGYISNFGPGGGSFDPTNTQAFNAVRVKVRRDNTKNGELPLFFARVFGRDGQSIVGQATAAIVRDVKGFRATSDGSNIDILPITLDHPTWVSWSQGNGQDLWTWNPETKTVSPGADGWPEVNIYPIGSGSPGNRGMVDIGGSNNSTADIARQILYGISGDDLAHHGGKLEFDSMGKLYLNGDTGISAGVKDELATIKGQPRTIPIFESVHGPGNNAIYTIVAWQGIRIMDVKLTGPMNKKNVTVQVAPVVGRGIIPSETSGTSSYVYSPAILIE